MFLGNNCLMVVLSSMTRSRTFTGLLCLLFLMLPIRVIATSCNAFEMEKAHINHFHITPGINWNHSLMSHAPFGNGCSCSSSASSCCMGAVASTPKDSNASLPCRDTLRQLSILKTTMTIPFAYTPLVRQYRYFQNFSSFHQEEFFLVNCTFLI